MNWTNEKPDFNEECLLITANNFSGMWAYKLWTIEKLEIDGHWYLGLLCEDGEEWGDLDDLKADLYCVLPLLELTTPNPE